MFWSSLKWGDLGVVRYVSLQISFLSLSHTFVYHFYLQILSRLFKKCKKGLCEILLPGLAVGESMDLDSLLPPALSESLHIPPWLPWLLEAQALSVAWLLSAAEKHSDHQSHTHRINRREKQINSPSGDILSVSFSYFEREVATLIFQTCDLLARHNSNCFDFSPEKLSMSQNTGKVPQRLMQRDTGMFAASVNRYFANLR